MRFTAKQTQQVKQIQKFHQKQIHDLQILMMSNEELDHVVQEALECNPFLEVDSEYYSSPYDKELLLNYVKQEKTLSQLLIEQVHWNRFCKHHELLEYLIYSLDSNGYLYLDTSRLCNLFGCQETEIEQAIQTLHTLQPYGVGARSVQECCLIQLRYSCHPARFLAKRIVEEGLEYVANKKVSQLARHLEVDVSEITQAIQCIRSLNPKPGASYAKGANYIEADITLNLSKEGLAIELKDQKSYHLVMSTQYELIQDPLIKKFRKIYTAQALQLIESIIHRCTTLMDVTAEILKIQQAYFLHEGCLKAMTLADVAKSCQLNESTISRCIQDKYVEFDGKILALKDLFSSSVQSGESSFEIKDRIQNLILQEEKSNPFSDQKLKELLQLEGIQLSRSAIAKYRNEMKIPSTLQRRTID